MVDKPGEFACLGRELEAVKQALSSILQQENPLPPHAQDAREVELTRRLSAHGSPAPANALDPQDLSIISRLLHQVHLLMEEDNGGEVATRLGSHEKPSDNVHAATEKKMVESVVEIASAAAQAAKAAAALSGKNLEVMETLLSNSEKNPHPRPTYSGSNDDNDRCINTEVPEDESLRPPSIDKDLVKKLERQNRITHWILGFMIVGTAIWRFKMLSMILGVRKTVTNPFQAIGGIFSEGFKGGDKEDENGLKGLHKAKAVLPSLLGGDDKDIVRKKEKAGHSTTEDFKIGEALTVSLDNILSVGKFNDGGASGSAAEDDIGKE